MLKLAQKLWPFCRSLTGKGNRQTLYELKKQLKSLKINNVESGEKIFDWKIPYEWVIKDAYIICPDGKKIAEFKKNNLHLVSYSSPVNKIIKYDNLIKKIHYLKNKPSAIPYVTSYYEKYWGFCLSYNQFKKLKKGNYRVVINSKFIKGNLVYGEFYLKGKTKKEVLLSTNICHPSMANNELSGIVVCTEIGKWLLKQKKLNNSYRIVFVPETIGALAFIKNNLSSLRKNVIGGYTVVCVGDERNYSYLPSRSGNTLSDRIAKKILYSKNKKFKKYSWLDRGSDERQYCSPGIDLPIASMMKTKYAEYKEYHTSLDKLFTVVTKKGLKQSFEMYKDAIRTFENNFVPKIKILGEPFFKKRFKEGLTKKNVTKEIFYKSKSKLIIDIFSYCDGKNTILDIAEIMNLPFKKVYEIKKNLEVLDFIST